MPGWFPCGSDSWPLVAEALRSRGEPWPYKLMLDDLAWWADQEKVSKGRKKRPGRPKLIARWGTTERIARKALVDPAWRDRQKTDVQPMSSSGPANVQPMSSSGPAPATANANNQLKMSSLSPANVQPMSSSGPADVLTRVEDTHTPPTQPPAPEREVGGSGEPDPTAPSWAKAWLKTTKLRPKPKADDVFRSVGLVLEAIRQKPIVPSPSTAAPVLRLFTEMVDTGMSSGMVDAVKAIAEACHDCDDPMFKGAVRGENSDGTRWKDKDASRDVAAVCRKGPKPDSGGATWQERLEVALAHQEGTCGCGKGDSGRRGARRDVEGDCYGTPEQVAAMEELRLEMIARGERPIMEGR